MKVLKLPEILRPAVDLVAPRDAMRLAATREGLDLGIPNLRPLPSVRLRGFVICTAQAHHAELPFAILYFDGVPRPFSVEGPRIRLETFGVRAAPRAADNVRQVFIRVVRKLPRLVIDDATERFLRGGLPREMGSRIIDLSVAFGEALKSEG